MAHLRSQDPFDFVGKHVIRGLPRAPHKKEHGWITRYDAEIDCYWLFVPGGGPPRRLTRAEVIKFVANPRIEMRDDDQDAFPPPIEDATSRFVGVPVVKSAAGASKRRRKAPVPVAGKVVCFLPFADMYRVEYADGSTEELAESAIVDCMIAQLKAQPSPATSPEVIDVDAVSTRTGGRKRPRVDATSSPELEEVPEPPPASPRMTSSSPANRQIETEVAATVGISSETNEDEEGDYGVELDSNVYETEEDEAIPEYSPPPPSSEGPVSILELDEAMADFIPVDEDEVIAGGEDFSVLNADGAPAQPSSPRSPSKLPFYIIEDATHAPTWPMDRRSTAFEYLRQWLLNLLDRQEAGSRKSPQQYDVLRNSDIKDRDAIRRFIDADGLYVLNDLLAAFVNADTDEGDDDLYFVLKVVAMLPFPSHDQVVQSSIGKAINIVAKSSVPKDRWRPIPKCITQLAKWIKTRWLANIKAPPKKTEPPKPAPPSHTARPSRPMQKHRIYAPVPSSIPRGPSLMVAGTPAQNRMPTDEPPLVNDPTPIPRLSRRGPAPVLAAPSHPFVEIPKPARPPPVRSFAATRSMNRFSQARPPAPPRPAAPQQRQQQDPVRRGSLKPDWMRQSEELSRSRFTAQSDTSAERRHYQATQAAPAAGTTKQKKKNEDQAASAGGPDGVFGRHQRLKFRKHWMQKEFDSSQPPVTVSGSNPRQPPGQKGGRWMSTENAQPFRRFPSPMFVPSPRPILRRDSKYNKELELPV